MNGRKLLREPARFHNKYPSGSNYWRYQRGQENKKRLTPDFYREDGTDKSMITDVLYADGGTHMLCEANVWEEFGRQIAREWKSPIKSMGPVKHLKDLKN